MATPSINSKNLVDICNRNDIAFLGVFGSYARGNATATSDIDLFVRFSRDKSLLEMVRIERELAERLEKPVDLVTEASLSPYLRDRVRSEIKTLYEKAR